MKPARVVTGIVLQLLVASVVAWAQSAVTGRVVDPQGAVVSGAELTLSRGAQAARFVRVRMK